VEKERNTRQRKEDPASGDPCEPVTNESIVHNASINHQSTNKKGMVTNLLLFLVLILTPIKLYAFCMKPNPPYKPFSFTSNQQVELYNQQVDRYNKELEMYGQCTAREINSYSQQFKDYIQCEIKTYGNSYSSCTRPTPPRN
jgi:hypothetical protein